MRGKSKSIGVKLKEWPQNEHHYYIHKHKNYINIIAKKQFLKEDLKVIIFLRDNILKCHKFCAGKWYIHNCSLKNEKLLSRFLSFRYSLFCTDLREFALFLKLADEISVFKKNQQSQKYDHKLVTSLAITLKLIKRTLWIKNFLTKLFLACQCSLRKDFNNCN